jgi:predicted Ser/Thr protein kinase
MGQVFRAYDTETDREVALKVLAPQVAQDASFEQRFRREAHVAARLNDPHVVPIHSYGAIDGRLYVDMRLIAGRDLGSVLEESGAMNPARAVGIIEQVADALDAAHSIDLVHRDIKPSNILLGRRDFVYLIDFGIAQDVNATRITKTGLAIGTFAYMAPERLGTGEAGRSSDIYSLACVLHECLTGQLPFPGGSMESQIAGHLSAPPPRPSMIIAGVGQAFDEVIARGMAKDPGQRYPTVLALAEAARRALDHQPRETLPPPAPTRGATMEQTPPWPPTRGPRPPAPGPTYVAPAPEIPIRGGEPARLQGTPRGQQLGRPVNFVAPGVLITVFAAVSIILAIIATGYSAAFVSVCLWLVLALAFGLVAMRCRAGERAVAIVSWLTCVAVPLGAMPLMAQLLRINTHVTYGYVYSLLTAVTFVTFIAFGFTSHRPFGWRWSVPASFAGLLGIVSYPFGVGALLGAIWLVPLLILGITLCRTRVGGQSSPS